MLQDLRAHHEPGFPKPIGIRPDSDKAVRLEACSAQIENGEVFLPGDADWLGPFLNELLGFPNARHDDQVDAFSQLLAHILERERNETPAPVGGIIWTRGD